MLPLLVCLTLAAPPRVLVVSSWGEVRGPGGAAKWSGPTFVALACTLPDAGLADGPNCLGGVPASAAVTMLDGSVEKTVGKKIATVSDVYACDGQDGNCQPQPLWLRPPPKRSKAPASQADDSEEPFTLAELRSHVGFWPKDIVRFALVPGAKDVPLPKELKPLPRPRTKKQLPDDWPPPRTGDAVSFNIPGSRQPFLLLMVGDAFAYKAPGAAGYIWGGGRSTQHLELLGAMDLDGNGHPELVIAQQHSGDTLFGVTELGPQPRGIGGHGGLMY